MNGFLDKLGDDPIFLLSFGIPAMVIVGSGWIVLGCLMGKAPKLNIDVTVLLLICAGVNLAVSLVIAFFMGIPRASLGGWCIGCGVLIMCGIANYFQLHVMSRAMQKGPNGIIWTIAQSGFIFPFAIGVLCFNTPAGWLRITGFVLVIISLIILGLCGDGNNEAKGNWKILALVTFLITGGSQTLSNLPSYFESAEPITTWWRSAAFASGLMAGGLICHCRRLPEFFHMFRQQIVIPEIWKMGTVGSLTYLITSLFFLYPGMNALEKANAGAIAYPIMVCSCLIIFELYAVLILREKRSKLQLMALLICIIGAVGICG